MWSGYQTYGPGYVLMYYGICACSMCLNGDKYDCLVWLYEALWYVLRFRFRFKWSMISCIVYLVLGELSDNCVTCNKVV